MAKKNKIPKISENVNLESAFSGLDFSLGEGEVNVGGEVKVKGLDSGTSPRMTGGSMMTGGVKVLDSGTSPRMTSGSGMTDGAGMTDGSGMTDGAAVTSGARMMDRSRATGRARVTGATKHETPLQAIDRLTLERDSVLLELADAEREISSLKVAIKKEAEKVNEAEQQLEERKNRIDSSIAIRSRIDILEARLAEAQRESITKDSVIFSQEKELAALREKTKDFATSSALADDVARRHKEKSRLDTELSNIEKEIRRKQRKLDSAGEKLGKTKRELAKVEKRKKSASGGELGEEYNALYNEYEQLYTAYEDLRAQNAAYEDSRSQEHQDDETILKRANIVLIGAKMIQENKIETIFNKAGFEYKNVLVVDDYDKLTNRSFTFLRDVKYKAVLVGPVPHSMKNLGDESSILEMLADSAYPPVFRVQDKSGNLKITDTSLREAVVGLRRYLVERNRLD